MKKHLKLLALTLIPLVLGGCKDKTPTPDNGTTNTNEGGGNEVVEPEIEIKIDEVYTSTTWDKKINKMAERAVGDLWNKIPTFIAPDYEAVVYVGHDGDETFPVFKIKCFNPNSASALRLYREKMLENEFTLSSLGNYGYLMKDYSSDLFVNFDVVEDDNSYFEILAAVRETRMIEWDSKFIDLYAGAQVPVCPAPAYQCLYDNSRDQVIVLAQFIEKNGLKTYEGILKAAGYTYSSISTSETVVYDDPTGYISVQIYQTYGDYECDALYITITNSWPTISIMAFNGIADFPKLESLNATYDTYAYIDLGGEGKDEDYVLCVYYMHASTADFSAYVTKLTSEYKFVAGESTTTESGVMSINLSKQMEGYVVEITVSLSTATNEICIAFYQVLAEAGE